MKTISTADIMDKHPDLKVCAPIFKDYGRKKSFYGKIQTISCFEDNSKVRERLENENGEGKVLVVDGGASNRCALVGDNIAGLAIKNNWEGVVVNGAIRDSAQINEMEIGIKALFTCPKKSIKNNQGTCDVEVVIGGVKILPNHYLYCDDDGVVISPRNLELN